MSLPNGKVTFTQPFHVTVKLNSKGKIEYEVSIHAETLLDVEKNQEAVDAWARETFKGRLAGEDEKR